MISGERVAGTVGVLLTLLAAAAMADNPTVVNGDFEMPRIEAPFVSPVVVPGWIHNGATGLGNLARVGYTDGFGEITAAGHGSQFLLLGSGPEMRGTQAGPPILLA